MTRRFAWLAWALLTCLVAAKASTVRDKIYVELSTNFPCVRLMNGTHQVGCHSSKSGNVGMVFWLRNSGDLECLAKDASKHGPYVVLISTKLFNEFTEKQYSTIKPNVVGIIVFHDENSTRAPNTGYSDDWTCPSSLREIYAADERFRQCKAITWNPPGKGSRFIDWEVPIYLVINETEVGYLTKGCFEKYNQGICYNKTSDSQPLCAAQMTMFNHGAGDAVRCIRRTNMWWIIDKPVPMCGPLEGINIVSLQPYRNYSTLEVVEKSIFILAARTDSLSMFMEYSPGATAMGAIITWLAVVDAIGRNNATVTKLSDRYKRHLLPILFHGESFDYIGSSKFVWDLVQGNLVRFAGDPIKAPFNLSHIGFFLELSQLTNANSDMLFIHVDPNSLKDEKVKAKINKMCSSLMELLPRVVKPLLDDPVPPSSLQSFLKVDPTIPGIVLGDYNRSFEARYYNSFLDLPMFVDIDKFEKLAFKVANSTLALMMEWLNNNVKHDQHLGVDPGLISKLVECFMSWPSWNCTMIGRIGNDMATNEKNAFFNSIYNDSRQRSSVRPDIGRITGLNAILLPMVEFMLGKVDCFGETVNVTCENASSTEKPCYLRTNLFSDAKEKCCVCTAPVLDHLARSPAFEGRPFNEELLAKSEYSTWVESTYSILRMRIFLKNHLLWQLSMLIAGLLVFFTSLLVVLLVNKYSKVLFEAPLPVTL